MAIIGRQRQPYSPARPAPALRCNTQLEFTLSMPYFLLLQPGGLRCVGQLCLGVLLAGWQAGGAGAVVHVVDRVKPPPPPRRPCVPSAQRPSALAAPCSYNVHVWVDHTKDRVRIDFRDGQVGPPLLRHSPALPRIAGRRPTGPPLGGGGTRIARATRPWAVGARTPAGTPPRSARAGAGPPGMRRPLVAGEELHPGQARVGGVSAV